MKQDILICLHDNFTWLVEQNGFVITEEENEKKAYWTIYRSDIFVIKMVKYFREFYISLYKTGEPDKGVDLFNLLKYLNRFSSNSLEYNYFQEEQDVDIAIKNQFSYLSKTILDNSLIINAFFSSAELDVKLSQIREFMIRTYPNLVKNG